MRRSGQALPPVFAAASLAPSASLHLHYRHGFVQAPRIHDHLELRPAVARAPQTHCGCSRPRSTRARDVSPDQRCPNFAATAVDVHPIRQVLQASATAASWIGVQTSENASRLSRGSVLFLCLALLFQAAEREKQPSKQASAPDFPNLRDGMTHLCCNILL